MGKLDTPMTLLWWLCYSDGGGRESGLWLVELSSGWASLPARATHYFLSLASWRRDRLSSHAAYSLGEAPLQLRDGQCLRVSIAVIIPRLKAAQGRKG